MERKTTAEVRYASGLCTTCRSRTRCTFPRRAGVAVRECEEFDGEVSPPRGAPVTVRLEATAASDSAPGLCRWCDLQASCTFPRNDGGVWFCEEYR